MRIFFFRNFEIRQAIFEVQIKMLHSLCCGTV